MRIRVGLAATIVTVAAAGALLVPAGAGAFTPLTCAPGCDLVVNATVDEPDADPGDGACATVAGDCTLRAAVQEANADPSHAHEVLVPGGVYVLTRHGLDDDASHGDLDVRFFGQIVGAGQARTVVDGDDADRVFDIVAGAEGEISHLAVRHGRATDGPGGGIRAHAYPFHLAYLYVSDNEAVAGTASGAGGGIAAAPGAGDGGGIAALTETDIHFVQVAYNHAVNGAGIWWKGIQGSSGNDTFVGNHASGDGGGLYLTGSDNHFSGMTLSANTAGGHGGGVYLTPPEQFAVRLLGSTIASNSAPHAMGGGIWIAGTPSNDAAQVIQGSIVARNGGGGDCAGPGTLDSQGGNIDGDGSCGFVDATDRHGVDPLLDDLAYNGGPIQTRALESGSPAVDLWECGVGFGFQDARGVAREAGACDSGAFEVADCCPDYEAPYVPPKEEPPPPPKEGDCGVIRMGTLGDDALVGDRGHNQMYGRAGDDRIFGRSNSDCLYAGPGADFVRGGGGTDLLVGSTGNDRLSGGDDEDVVRGDSGSDRILGGDDEDRLFGGPGADYLKGGGGYDAIEAGPGDDTIDATGSGLDTVHCGRGEDHVRAKRQTQLSGCEHVHFVD
jgi:CSLREA domain-containing protein